MTERKAQGLHKVPDGLSEASDGASAENRAFSKSWERLNPALSPGELVVLRLSLAFFGRLVPTYNRWERARSDAVTAPSWEVAALTVLLLRNPVFHLDCRALVEVQRECRRIGKAVVKQSETVAVLNGLSSGMSGPLPIEGEQGKVPISLTNPMHILRFVSNLLQRAPSYTSEELAQAARQVGGAPVFKPLYQRSAPEFVAIQPRLESFSVEAVERAALFRKIDVELFLSQLSKGEPVSVASESDGGLLLAIEAYRTFVAIIKESSELVVRWSELRDVLQLSGFRTLEEASQAAVATVEKKLSSDRSSYGDRMRLKAEREALILAERQEAIHREKAASASAEAKRIIRQERERAVALQEYHSAFREVPLPSESVAIVDQISTGSGVPRQLSMAVARLNRVIEGLRSSLFDWRGDRPDVMGDPNVERLAKTIFSPTSLGLAARAFKIDAEKIFRIPLPSKTPVQVALKEVSDLYSSSRAARKIVLTMLEQSDGIVLLAGVFLPGTDVARYVADRNWDSYGVDRAGKDIRAPLAHRLRQIIEDGVVVKTARAFLPPLEALDEGKKAKIIIPDWIGEIVNQDEFVCSLEEGQLLVALRAAPQLALYIPPRVLTNKEQFRKEYKLCLDDLLSRREIEGRIETLRRSLGFDVSRLVVDEGEHAVTLTHSDYDLSARLTGPHKKWGREIDLLEQQFYQHQTSWDLLLERAQDRGFVVSRSSDGVSISHSLLGDHRLSFGHYIPVKQFPRVVALLDEARRAEDQSVIEKKRAVRNERILQEQVLPATGDDILVVDANVFMSLSAPRRHGGTWLDLLKSTSRLGSIRMIVPAVVADFEAQGKIEPFNTLGHPPTYTRGQTVTSTAMEATRKFFEGACRIKVGLDQSGRPALMGARLGENRDVIIVESIGDEAFYAKVREVLKAAGGDVSKLQELMQAHVYKQNQGDLAITRFLRACPFVNRVTVITSDIKYSEKEMPRSTGLGMPVSSCSIGSYVAAECGVRGIELAEILGVAESVHFHDIAAEVSAFERASRGQARYLFPHGRLGISGPSSGVRAAGIVEIIKSQKRDIGPSSAL